MSAPSPFPAAQELPPAPSGRPEVRIGLGGAAAVLQRNLPLAAAVLAAVMGLAAWALYRSGPQYLAEATLVLEQSSRTIDSGLSQVRQHRLTPVQIMTEVEVLRSRSFAAEAAARMGLAQDPAFNPYSAAPGAAPVPPDRVQAAVAAQLQERYSVLLHRGSLTITVLVRDSDGARAARIADGVVQTYVAQTLETRRAQAARAAAALEQRIAGLEASLAEAEEALSGLVRSNALDSRQQQQQLLLQLRQAYLQLEYLEQETPEDGDARAVLGAELSRLAGALETRTRAEQTRKTMERRLADLSESHAALQRQLHDLGAQAGLLLPLARQISRAVVPPQPNLPSYRTVLAGSFTGGLALALVAVLLREALDSRVFSGRMPLHGYGLRGSVPFPAIPRPARRSLPVLSALLARRTPAAAAAEAVRHLLSLLCRSGTGDQEPQPGLSFTVTAAQPGSGHGLVALCLAASAASEGHRVLLVCLDADPVRQLPLLQGLQPSPHLFEDLLEDPALLAREVSVAAEWIDVLLPAAGSQVPLNLAASPDTRAALTRLQREYDIILYWAPPVLQSAVAARLAPVAGQTVLVVRDRHTGSQALLQALEVMEHTGTPLQGVLNCG